MSGLRSDSANPRTEAIVDNVAFEHLHGILVSLEDHCLLNSFCSLLLYKNFSLYLSKYHYIVLAHGKEIT